MNLQGVNPNYSFNINVPATLNPFSLDNLPSVRTALEDMPSSMRNVPSSSNSIMDSIRRLPSWQISLGALVVTGLVLTILKKK